ncbi:MAG: hypothetical protein ACYDHT_13195 [Solirubrobacteraceae bacterium]
MTVLVLALGAFSALTAGAASASSEVVYNYLPSPIPGNPVSLGFEATQTAEFGGQIELAGTARKNPKVTVLMSSWACQTGSWNNFNCKTTMGAKFPVPITFKVSEVGPGNSQGAVLATGSKTFMIPYRPSANTMKCTGTHTGAWYHQGECFNGKSAKISLPLKAASLPNKVIVTIAYNTSDYGTNPTGCNKGPGPCPEDSLNVGVNDGFEEPSRTPSVGSLPLPAEAYVNGAPEAEWEGFQPLFEVKASA